MKMWSDTNNMVIDPPAPKPMPSRPQKKRRKAKNEPKKKKYDKLSKQGVKMTCSKYHRAITSLHANQGIEWESLQVNSQLKRLNKAKEVEQLKNLQQLIQAVAEEGETTLDLAGNKGRGAESAPPSDGQKRPRNIGFGYYTNPTTGTTVINPGSSGERVVSYGTKVVKDTSAVNIDLGFKSPGLNFKGRNAITTSHLQQLIPNRRNQIGSSSTTSSIASPAPPAP